MQNGFMKDLGEKPSTEIFKWIAIVVFLLAAAHYCYANLAEMNGLRSIIRKQNSGFMMLGAIGAPSIEKKENDYWTCGPDLTRKNTCSAAHIVDNVMKEKSSIEDVDSTGCNAEYCNRLFEPVFSKLSATFIYNNFKN